MIIDYHHFTCFYNTTLFKDNIPSDFALTLLQQKPQVEIVCTSYLQLKPEKSCCQRQKQIIYWTKEKEKETNK